MSPLLSVIIPAYNIEDFIVPSISSALDQTFRDLEVIVVDDGSSDSTPERIASIRDNRIRCIRQNNAGLAAARNTGIRASRGKYIGLLDGDDVWLSEKAEQQISVMEKEASIGITFTYSAYIDERGERTGQSLITSVTEPSFVDLIIRNHILPSSAIILKDCFLKAGLFNERLHAAEDYEMWVRILHKTPYRARLIPKVLVGYRVRSDSLTMNYNHQIRNAQMVMEVFRANIPEFSKKLEKRALGEIYRILSRKALSNRQLDWAKHLMKEALHVCPTIVVRDLRAFGTVVLIGLQSLLPERWQPIPYKFARWLMKMFYRFYTRSPNKS